MEKTSLSEKRRPSQSFAGNRGVTIIEIIMAIVIIGIISGTVAVIMIQGARSFGSIEVREDLKGEGSVAIERMARELRLIKCTTAGNSCAPTAADITAMTAAELRFVNSDFGGAGFRLDAPASALKLRRGSGAGDPEDTLSGNVTGLSFEYLRQNGAAAAAPADVWIINVTLTLAKGDEAMTFRTTVHPRGFR